MISDYANRETDAQNRKGDGRMNKAYIYMLKNNKNNKCYIGQSTNNKRKWTHFNHLKHNKHHNYKLQDDYNEYGENVFSFEVLEELNDILKISDRENYWIEKYNSIKNGYNIAKGGSGIVTLNARKNMSKSQKGKSSSKRTFSDYEAILIYSIYYFYGKVIRPLSKVTKYNRNSLKSILSNYDNIRQLFNQFDINIKYSIFQTSIKYYNFSVLDTDYFPENIFYLVHMWYAENVYTIKEMSVLLNKTERTLRRIINGEVKPDIYDIYIDGKIDKEKLLILSYLSKNIGNPVPSLERNF